MTQRVPLAETPHKGTLPINTLWSTSESLGQSEFIMWSSGCIKVESWNGSH